MEISLKKRNVPWQIFEKERSFFIENFSALLSSGTDILFALEALKSETRNENFKKIIDELKNDIDAGSPIWRALANTRLLPSHFISLVRVGEAAGRLPQNLAVIASQQQKDRVFRSRIRAAMIYPAFVFSLTVAVSLGVTWFIFPRLSVVFSGLNLELPAITRVVISIGTFLNTYGTVAVPLFVLAAAALVYVIFYLRRTKVVGEKIIFFLPPTRRLLQEVELARFGYLLGSLLNAGVSILDAIESLEQAATSHIYRDFYKFLRQSFDEGNNFFKSYSYYPRSHALFPVSVQSMIVSAERSGRLPGTLNNIGAIYEAKTELSAKNVTVLLEPALLFLVWLGVAAVAIAVILPIYSLIGGINQV